MDANVAQRFVPIVGTQDDTSAATVNVIAPEQRSFAGTGTHGAAHVKFKVKLPPRGKNLSCIIVMIKDKLLAC